MVDIQSKEIIDKISEELKVQPALQIPRALGKEISLFYKVNPMPQLQIIGAVASDAATATIHTTHTTKRTFLVGAAISTAKDVVNDGTTSRLSGTPLGGGADRAFVRIQYEPLTAESNLHAENMFPFPLELEKGSIVTIRNNQATASIDSFGTIFFYETDPQ